MTTSYNGWPASPNPDDFGGLTMLKIGTETFPPGVRSGDVWVVLSYVAAELDKRVEKVAFPGGHPADDWGFNYRQNRNSDNLSCHASGTAFDYNATRHPNGVRGTWTAAQKREVRKILAEVDDVVRWGEDFTGTVDGMHFEICGSAAQVAVVATRLRYAAKITTEESDMPLTDADVKKIADAVVPARAKDKRDKDPLHITPSDLATILERMETRLAVIEGKLP